MASHWQAVGQGVIKGLGGAVGFTILGAIVMAILTSLAAHNIPVIGDFIAKNYRGLLMQQQNK